MKIQLTVIVEVSIYGLNKYLGCSRSRERVERPGRDKAVLLGGQCWKRLWELVETAPL